ncbi:nitrate- and nitrite sensing domain-containing protein [Streptomyces sp. NBC_01142]|uniref:sensor histidine kinase n=1 Tax=Streptomyces sp. NBC_01142 TaxID=2975865 RepID=UPI002255EFA9|nr:nitrate- and nitrite sensing domain-containing protein [Streptomyces sp. NBC_01142]MCX4819605.1 nitrate- and nitrite sensing domain-containing protein [Streptomyces sp. NBC_01142]
MQGRFKRDGSAAAEQEPRGGTDRGSSPQHTQNQGPAAPGDSGDRAARPGAAAPGGKEPKVPLKPKGPTDTGSRIALRNWRISTRLVSLLTLPVVAATTLGGLRINESMDDMKQLDHMQLLTNMTKEATELAQALQAERDLSAGPLSNGTSATDFKVAGPRAATDRIRKSFLDATRDIENTGEDEALESIRANANQIAVQVNQLNKIRSTAYDKDVPDSMTVEGYSRLIESLLSLSQDMAQATSNPEMIKRTRALAAFSSAKEYASIQRAIIAAALPGGADAKAPGLSENDRLYGKAAMENGDTELKAFKSIYESSGGNAEELTDPLDNGNPTITASELYAKRVLDNKDGLADQLAQNKRSHLDWTDDYSVRINAMKTIEATLLGEMESKARELREQSQRVALINGALILVVLGVSLVGAFVVARSMIRSLRRLQDTATKVAQDRLPELVKQLSEADPQDVDTSVESVGVHSRDEIGQVAAAFDDVHREAVRLAAEQALLRGNVNAMFTNLSRRSQGLIQRQLSLISELESREADPDQLSSLFKLDHLATRMRRNGENLLVLAGEEPGRRWTRPVPLVDVLRAAASEVEQYERIELSSVPTTEVAGRVVNDLVHLLAELLENATSFSSPQTKVKVTGHALPDGRVLVEIHDTGIGLSPEDLAAINERLASPPTVDVSVSRRMGLFVVGRLSLRHGIRIQLRPSDSGGTTALVMLPVDVANGGKKVPAKPGAGGQGGVPSASGAPAGLGGRPAGSASAPGGGRPGLGGAPGSTSSGSRLGAGAPRGQVGAGAAPRAALPGRDNNPPRQGQGQHAQSPQGPGQGQSGQGQGQGGQGQSGRGQGGGLAGAFGSGAGRGAQSAPARNEARQNGFAPAAPGQGDRGRQLPAPGGPRPELPGGNSSPAPRREEPAPQRPQTTSWGSEQPSAPQQRPSADSPRGHDDHEGSRGPAATEQFARPDFNAPAPRSGSGAGSTGQFVRPDVYGSQDPASTAQFGRPDMGAPQPPAPAPAPRRRDNRDAADFSAPRPMNALPPQPQPEALPPAGPGDGRTPLYDTLETNWFHGPQSGQPAEQPQAPAVPQQPAERPAPAMPQRSPAPNPATPGNAPNASSAAWRSSPNDELVRQAERVRKPAAGGVTTSGLPRRVPRANLVPGTAQEQSNQAGPQVSRAPDDVRGRLTNLRRGIQQGRQQNSTTGSFNLGPTHQQER